MTDLKQLAAEVRKATERLHPPSQVAVPHPGVLSVAGAATFEATP